MKGIVKQGKNSWYYQVSLGKKPDGSRNQVKKRGFKTEKEAQQALRKAITEFEDGLYISPHKMLFKLLAVDYLNYKKRYVTPVTIECYHHLFRSIILQYFENIRIDKIDSRLLYQFYGEMHDEKRSGGTMVKVHDLIKGAFDFAVKNEYVAKNPMDKVDRPKKGKRDITVWDAKQIEIFLTAARTSPYYIVYYVALITGMRQGEILGLRWKDIDFDSNTIYITQTRKSDGKLQYGAKNNSSMRSLTIIPSQMDQLRFHYENQRNNINMMPEIYEDNDLVTASEIGTAINPSNLRRDFKKIISKTELPVIRFHDLRHTHATLLLTLKINSKTVALRLGHSNVKTTLDTYTHPSPDVQKEVSSEVAKVIHF